MRSLLFVFLLLPLCTLGQLPKHPVKTKVNQDSVYTFVETPPGFPGGEIALATYLAKNIHLTNEIAEEGRFSSFVSFVIDTSGCISDV
ncbi:MAG: hypothetical protein J7623_12905 [Chitinophaga sp.]|uniref:hypothetical protein n=1 Tax=Chitinophaga sp. TaxID=1869181 RepID=UPI001B09188C|nr:hypothetical protein [Chitinophaga sp.]MBO9729529.1 hypothetical protein [Chitinophaga sp.]